MVQGFLPIHRQSNVVAPSVQPGQSQFLVDDMILNQQDVHARLLVLNHVTGDKRLALGLRFTSNSQNDLNKVFTREGLAKVGRKTSITRPLGVPLQTRGREHYQGEVLAMRQFTDFFCGFKSVKSWHSGVQQNQITGHFGIALTLQPRQGILT